MSVASSLLDVLDACEEAVSGHSDVSLLNTRAAKGREEAAMWSRMQSQVLCNSFCSLFARRDCAYRSTCKVLQVRVVPDLRDVLRQMGCSTYVDCAVLGGINQHVMELLLVFLDEVRMECERAQQQLCGFEGDYEQYCGIVSSFFEQRMVGVRDGVSHIIEQCAACIEWSVVEYAKAVAIANLASYALDLCDGLLQWHSRGVAHNSRLCVHMGRWAICEFSLPSRGLQTPSFARILETGGSQVALSTSKYACRFFTEWKKPRQLALAECFLGSKHIVQTSRGFPAWSVSLNGELANLSRGVLVLRRLDFPCLCERYVGGSLDHVGGSGKRKEVDAGVVAIGAQSPKSPKSPRPFVYEWGPLSPATSTAESSTALIVPFGLVLDDKEDKGGCSSGGENDHTL